jgi:transposase InsO family protein
MASDDSRRDTALFRLAVLGELIHTPLPRGELRRVLEAKASKAWTNARGESCRIAAKTIHTWLRLHRRGGFPALYPQQRSDRHRSRSIPPELATLILDMKREDPGRSAPVIRKMLVDAGRVKRSDFSVSSIVRLLARHGLSGPKMELEVAARHRFSASAVNELWQVDACHGPKLFDPASGRETRVKIFGLIDDKSRLITYLRASFHEREQDFLRTLFEAVRRRGVPRCLLLDNHGSFTGADVQVTCARLSIRLVHARPYDGASKGKIERFWRTLRAQVLDRLDPGAIRTLEDLNLRLMTYADGDYNVRPHSGIGARTPLELFEEEAAALRFLADPAELESHFVAELERTVRNDATCTINGRCYEVPQHLRRKKVKLGYAVLRPDTIWVQDGETRVPLREVDPVANAYRSRTRRNEETSPPKPTGMNPVEGLIQRALHDRGSEDRIETIEEGGDACALC